MAYNEKRKQDLINCMSRNLSSPCRPSASCNSTSCVHVRQARHVSVSIDAIRGASASHVQ